MNWNDYEAVWKRQELPTGEDADVESVRATLETKGRKLRAVLLLRDFAEAGAGLLVSAGCARIWWDTGRDGWPIALSMALILGISGVFVRERFRARRLRIGADASLLAKVEADIAELRHQCHLVRYLWAWYLAPCFLSIAIVCAVIVHRAPPWGPLHDPVILVGFGAFFALVFWFAWEINRRALRKRLEPRLAELEKLRNSILSAE
jgi:hypothetical protein